jgi:methylglutaconyl-CoA hydratase
MLKIVDISSRMKYLCPGLRKLEIIQINKLIILMYKTIKRTFSSAETIISKVLGQNGNILGLYLNNPKTKNALSKCLIASLKKQIDYVNLNHEIRVVLLMSNQAGYFCTGADLKERATMSENEVELFVDELRTTFNNFSEMRVPSIAALDGYALGGGLELAMSSDIRIATKGVTLGLTEVGLGIIPGAGGTQRLSRLIGISKAKEMIFTAEKVNGEQAKEIGLVNHVVEDYSQLEIKGVEIAEKIVSKAPLAITFAKKAINQGIGHDIKVGLEIERLCYNNILKTEDRLEGMKAFNEKRQPVYKGK